jgi:hypothetical protein
VAIYSERKINGSLGNVTVRGGKRWKGQGGARWPTVCLSMYSITENIYYSQLSSVAMLLQPEPNCFHIHGKDCVLSSCAIALRSSPSSHVSTCNGQRSSQLFCVHYTQYTVVCKTVQLRAVAHATIIETSYANRAVYQMALVCYHLTALPSTVCMIAFLQSTDHELIPARNACRAATPGSASEVMFVTIQSENIRPSKKEMNKAVKMLIIKIKLPDVCSYAVNHYVSLSLTNRKSSVNLHALYPRCTALTTFTPRRDQLVICKVSDLSDVWMKTGEGKQSYRHSTARQTVLRSECTA